jgi:hypothetical protein
LDAAWASSLLSVSGINSPVVLRLVEDCVCHGGGGVPPAHYHHSDINGSSAFVLTSLNSFETFMESSHSLILKMPSAITPPPTPMKAGIEIAIDRGGTFCDCLATNIPGREDIVVKLLSVDPSNYDDAPTVSSARAIKAVKFLRQSRKESDGYWKW